MKGKYGRMFLQAYDCIACRNLVFWSSTVTSHNSFISVLQNFKNFKMLSQVGQKWIETPQYGDSPISQQKKEDTERFVTHQKPNWMVKFCEQEHQHHCYQLHCICFSKGKTSLCSTVSVPPLHSKIWSVSIIAKTFTDWKSQFSASRSTTLYVKNNKTQWNTSYSFQPLTL